MGNEKDFELFTCLLIGENSLYALFPTDIHTGIKQWRGEGGVLLIFKEL